MMKLTIKEIYPRKLRAPLQSITHTRGKLIAGQ